MNLSLYIHIPLCRSKCQYCDFYSAALDEVAGEDGPAVFQKRLLDSIIRELRMRLAELRPGRITSVFIGGGTPSIIEPKLLDHFLSEIEGETGSLIPKKAEWSIEANPESCSADFLEVIRSHRVNRLSLGVQSFDTTILRSIGRAVYPEDVYGKVAGIRENWPGRLSVDIITAAGGDELSDIRKAVSLGTEHLSVYSLTVEEGTPLYDEAEKGRFKRPDENYQADVINEATTYLAGLGWERYEISNYAADGGEGKLNRCEHNIGYWNMQSYIGLGPGGVSSLYLPGQPRRISNTESFDKYIGAFEDKRPDLSVVREIEELSSFDFMFEHYMMGLRLKDGMDEKVFISRFGRSPEKLIPETLRKWRSAGLAEPAGCALNARGMMYLNGFLSEAWDELKLFKRQI